MDLPQRPESDRPLDAEIALRALRDQFPSDAFTQAVPLPRGWATDPYVVDNHLLVRFPRNAEVAEWLDWDETILEFVGSALGSRLRIPRVLYRGNPGEYFPHGYLVCDFIPGVPLHSAAASISDRLPAELGEALTQIHSISFESASAVGVEQPGWHEFSGTLFFLHGDFGPGNIIVDPSTGCLRGIIDWGNAQLGDRALDFHKLILDFGWSFTHKVLEAYRLPLDEGFLGRVKFHAQMQAAQWLADSVKRRLDPALHLRWVQNAFSLGQTF